MQEEDILKHTNGKSHVFTFSIFKWKIISSMLMLSIILYTLSDSL